MSNEFKPEDRIERILDGLDFERPDCPVKDSDLLDLSLIVLNAVHSGVANVSQLIKCFPDCDHTGGQLPLGLCEVLKKLLEDGLLTVNSTDAKHLPCGSRTFALTSLGRSVLDSDL